MTESLMQPDAPLVVLASASRSRQMLLQAAGVCLAATEPARIDEAEVKEALRREGAEAIMAAQTLAEMKAVRVSRRYSSALVIGADQLLVCDGKWYDKPANAAEAAAQIRELAGRTHSLETAVCVALDGRRIWHHNQRARLTMRPLGPGFIEQYLAAAGDDVLHSVGGYQLEGLGVQLFHRIDGDYFTVLGLPLLQLLAFLREHRVLAQ